MRASIILVAILGAALSLAAQPPSSQPSPLPGAIQLPNGFRHERLQGIDTEVGRISKDGGLAIHYDIGPFAGNYAGRVKGGDREWAIKQIVNGEPVEIVKSKGGHLNVTFTKKVANFYGNVSSEEDLATFLAIVLTYPAPQAAR